MITLAINRIFEAGYKKVVIPNFGAFIKRPSGETIFTDMLFNDDGVLIASLIGAGLTITEARNEVNKFIVSIKSELALNNRAIIQGVGIITKNAAGTITIDPVSTIESETTNVINQSAIIENQDSDNETIKIEEQQHNLKIEITSSSLLEEFQSIIGTSQNDIEKSLNVTGIAPDNIKPEANVESVEHEKDLSHPLFAKKTKLRNALYGDMSNKTKEIITSDVEPTIDNASTPDSFSDYDKIISEINIPLDTTTPQNTTKEEPHNHTNTPTITSNIGDDNEPFQSEIKIRRPNTGKKRIDLVMVVAVIALVITLSILIYGYFTERDINSIKGEEEILIEMTE